MTPEETERAEHAASAEYQRQLTSTTPEERSRALYIAVRAFQAALATDGADGVNDWLALCALLDQALSEYGEALDVEVTQVDPPIH